MSDRARIALRRVKYTFGASVIDAAIRHTSLLDGSEAPPQIINFSGGGDYLDMGRWLSRLLQERVDLTDGESLLDVGCGIGRLATALARDFPSLLYQGFDPVRYGITWCQKRFADSPGFTFRHVDLANAFYNPRGRLDSATIQFPYADESFDIVVATSVLTHISFAEASHYLAEMARCLRPDGRAYVTLFLLDPDAMGSVRSGRADIDFSSAVPHGRAVVSSQPEEAIAFDKASLMNAVSAAGLEPVTFFGGRWRGHQGQDFQDAWLLRRVDS
jgi:ubiquinone/menaquinone biosynthesis C-methylase UbiE